MKELSLHILDIVQNAISASASLVTIEIRQDPSIDRMSVMIADNGSGMSKEMADKVMDPFTTTRTTRKVGLGIPLFKLSAEQTGGTFSLSTELGKGTTVCAEYVCSSIDRPPVGDMPGTITALISMSPTVDFVYRLCTPEGEFEFDTRQAKEMLCSQSLAAFEVMSWIRDYLSEGILSVKGEIYE